MQQPLARALPWKHLLPRMINLAKRSYQKELLDKDAIPFEAIQQNMQELNTINTWLGGHAISIDGLKKIIQQLPAQKDISICEIGCGGGDNIAAIYKWCRRQNIKVSFTGIDIQPACIAFAKQQYPSLPVHWITDDYANVLFEENKPTIIFASLFCHHFTEPELISMLHWMKHLAAKGFFINDLQRHPLAYYSIKIITRLFSDSYLVKHDAPLSVARSFTKKEWQDIFSAAGIIKYSIYWKWAFRYLIVYNNG